MENHIVVVDTEPYCIWGHDIKLENQQFLGGIDTGYFQYILESHIESDPDKKIAYIDQVRASVVINSALHQAMEMMFTLLGSLIQSPRCTYGWMIKCQNNQLRNVISKINERDNSLYHTLKVNNISWYEVSNAIFQGVFSDKEEESKTISQFANLWERLAKEYCDRNKTLEYNSIKHGLRIKSGGHGIYIGIQKEQGERVPQKDMTLMGGSKFGSSFLKLIPFSDERPNRSLVSKKVSLNWEIETIVNQLQLVVISIQNIVLRLKYINKCGIGEERFTKPQDDEDFDKAWKQYFGFSNMESFVFTDDDEPVKTTKKQLLDIISEIQRKKLANKS